MILLEGDYGRVLSEICEIKSYSVMKSYAIGDIHGNYKALIQAIERSPFDPNLDRIITLGDYIDGGSHIEILPVMEYLLSLPDWIGIIGNHDNWLKEVIEEGWNCCEIDWFNNGGRQTLEYFDIDYQYEGGKILLNGKLPDVVMKFIDRLVPYYIDESDNVYVHAGWHNGEARIEESNTIKNGLTDDLFWRRDFWEGAINRKSYPHNRVFIGHTPCKGQPEKRGNIWNLDSGATVGYPLTIMDIETERYWQSDETKKLYKNFRYRWE